MGFKRLANILADIIIPLAEVVSEFMAPGAYFISSGIIDMKAEEVKQALEENEGSAYLLRFYENTGNSNDAYS